MGRNPPHRQRNRRAQNPRTEASYTSVRRDRPPTPVAESLSIGRSLRPLPSPPPHNAPNVAASASSRWASSALQRPSSPPEALSPPPVLRNVRPRLPTTIPGAPPPDCELWHNPEGGPFDAGRNDGYNLPIDPEHTSSRRDNTERAVAQPRGGSERPFRVACHASRRSSANASNVAFARVLCPDGAFPTWLMPISRSFWRDWSAKAN